jgi:hypothetical protein
MKWPGEIPAIFFGLIVERQFSRQVWKSLLRRRRPNIAAAPFLQQAMAGPPETRQRGVDAGVG